MTHASFTGHTARRKNQTMPKKNSSLGGMLLPQVKPRNHTDTKGAFSPRVEQRNKNDELDKLRDKQTKQVEALVRINKKAFKRWGGSVSEALAPLPARNATKRMNMLAPHGLPLV
jgi:hypothetical protein